MASLLKTTHHVIHTHTHTPHTHTHTHIHTLTPPMPNINKSVVTSGGKGFKTPANDPHEYNVALETR